MDQLWAPWRTKYILGSQSTGDDQCFVCRAVDAPPEQDAENLLVWRGDRSIVLLNRYPYNNGHLLVAPRAHQGSLAELDPASLADGVETVRRMVAALGRLMHPDGFNIGLNLGRVAGAGLPGHLHWHVVPRWAGDTNFMPVVSDTKVISQSLSELYNLLRDELSP